MVLEPKYGLRFGGDWTPQSFSDNMIGCLGQGSSKIQVSIVFDVQSRPSSPANEASEKEPLSESSIYQIFRRFDVLVQFPVYPYPSLPNTLWVGVWTRKHLLRKAFRGSKYLLTRYLGILED